MRYYLELGTRETRGVDNQELKFTKMYYFSKNTPKSLELADVLNHFLQELLEVSNLWIKSLTTVQSANFKPSSITNFN